MKKLLTFIFLFPTICFGQKQGNIWYFGNHAGLDFNSGVPVALSDGATYNDNYPHSEGTAVISDSSGSLLFYTNGQKIWNKNHTVMPNGDSLLGNLSSTQAALIVPKPGSSQLFYVFTTDGFYQNNLQYGFRYSIVDICLDNGLGDVITNEKNILLLDTVAEKLTAVRHSNGTDYWIITHKFFSDAFYSYLLTSAGIVDTVVTHIGSIHQEHCGFSVQPTRSALGWLKASPDGTKLACVNGQTCLKISELFDFNKTTGVVSNVLQLYTDSIAVALYGVSFSPDNSKLYISSQINHDRIYQYDLSSGNPTVIVNSKTIVADHSSLGGPFYMAMVLGPDGKLYIAERNQTHLGGINFPNLAGTNCNYVDAAVQLSGSCSFGLPNFIDFYNYSNTIYNCETSIDEESTFHKALSYPNPFNDQLTFVALDKELTTVVLYNFYGQQVLQQTFIKSTTINTEQLEYGIYFYQLRNSKKVNSNGKVIKN